MAVKNCKECGKQVSTKAKKCPHCGAKAPKRTSLLVWVLIGVIGYVFYMVGQGNLDTAPSKAESSLSAEQQAEIEREAERRAQASYERDLVYEAKKTVAASLKDPDSAQFRDVFFNETAKGGSVVCGQVNSKNSLGAYTGFQRFISNGQTTFLEEKDSNIGETWAQVCLPDNA